MRRGRKNLRGVAADSQPGFGGMSLCSMSLNPVAAQEGRDIQVVGIILRCCCRRGLPDLLDPFPLLLFRLLLKTGGNDDELDLILQIFVDDGAKDDIGAR